MILRWLLCFFILIGKAEAGGVIGRWAGDALPIPPNFAQNCAGLFAFNQSNPCAINYSQFRQVDTRLTAIENLGVAGSGLFAGSIYNVSTASQLNALSGKLNPGDKVILADGAWIGQNVNFSGVGTWDHPIILMGNSIGGPVFSGASSLTLTGQNIVVYGLTFSGVSTTDGNTIFHLGTTTTNCDNCIIDRVVMTNITTPNPDVSSTIYLTVTGFNDSVVNSTFSFKSDSGYFIGVNENSPPQSTCTNPPSSTFTGCYSRVYIANNVFSDFPNRVVTGNGWEAIQMGSSTVSGTSSFNVFDGNTFTRITGENETVTIKQNDVIIQNNTFKDNLGTLSLRNADRVVVQNNTFDGTNQAGMGGVRFSGQGHWIVGNTFINLTNPSSVPYYPITIFAGDVSQASAGDVYPLVQNVAVSWNKFIGCSAPLVALGFQNTPATDNLWPQNVYFSWNDVRGASSGFLTDLSSGQAAWSISNNMYSQHP